jgi:hypothetical protein
MDRIAKRESGRHSNVMYKTIAALLILSGMSLGSVYAGSTLGSRLIRRSIFWRSMGKRREIRFLGMYFMSAKGW